MLKNVWRLGRIERWNCTSGCCGNWRKRQDWQCQWETKQSLHVREKTFKNRHLRAFSYELPNGQRWTVSWSWLHSGPLQGSVENCDINCYVLHEVLISALMCIVLWLKHLVWPILYRSWNVNLSKNEDAVVNKKFSVSTNKILLEWHFKVHFSSVIIFSLWNLVLL